MQLTKRAVPVYVSFFLQGDVQEAFRELMARHRNLKFVSVDSTKLETNLEKKLGLKPFDGSHQLVHFTRYNVTAKAKVRPRCFDARR